MRSPKKLGLLTLCLAVVGGIAMLLVQLRSVPPPQQNSEKQDTTASQVDRQGSAAPPIHQRRTAPLPVPLADSKTQSGPPIVPEDPKESLRREVDTLFASIQKPAVMPKGWRSAASSAYETVRSRVAAGLGDDLVSADAIKCETNGCVARLQYRQLSGYQRALRVF